MSIQLLMNAVAGQGHTVLSQRDYRRYASAAGVSWTKVDVDHLVSKGEIIRVNNGITGGTAVLAEAAIARSLGAYRRAANDPRPAYGLTPTMPLAPQQAAAWGLLNGGFPCALTGRPGTGKTYLSAAFIHALTKSGRTVDVAAPTGKAVSVLASKLDGIEVRTIHRLLGLAPGQLISTRKLECDVLLVDEASMIGSGLMSALLGALDKDTQLVLVGDPDQLNPVDPGRPFYDIVRNNLLPVARLTEPQRQSMDSGLLQMAYGMADGKFVFPAKDVTHFNLPPERVLSEAVDLYCSDRVVNRFGLTDKLRQQLCLIPVKDDKFAINTVRYNTDVSQRLHPARLTRSKFAVGDRMIFTVNNYEYGFVNGEMGILRSHGGGVTTIENDRGLVYSLEEYKLSKMAEWGYGLTVHKSQGSEADVVTIMLDPSAGHMYTRNLLYTALTRAKKHAILIGDLRCFQQAVTRGDYRETALPELMERPELVEDILNRHGRVNLREYKELAYLTEGEE